MVCLLCHAARQGAEAALLIIHLRNLGRAEIVHDLFRLHRLRLAHA
jgi:hypothetical protein